MKILVLGGGSIRSSYQVGAVVGLLKKGYKPDAIYGISGGSLVALLLANFVGQQGVDKELIDWDLIADQMSYFWLNNITAPEDLVKIAEGHTFELDVTDTELEAVKEQYTVISTIPSENGWQVQVVGESMDNKSAKAITPNLEHAYVYFMEQQN